MRGHIVGLLFVLGCQSSTSDSKETSVEVGTDSGGTPVTTDTKDTADTADTAVSDPATITGAVTVELTTTDSFGNVVVMDWKDAYGTDFPFGSVFVAAYVVDEATGRPNYLSQTVVDAPVPGANPYTLDLAEPGEVLVYAALDYWSDGVIATNDPTGLHPDPVVVKAGAETASVDVTVRVPYYDFNTTGGGGSDLMVTISGEAVVPAYTGGLCAALLYDSAGAGPYYAAVAKLSETGTGVYAMPVLKNFGTARLLGAWDQNANGLIDPDDAWGAYATAPDVDGNPITVGEADLPRHDLQIPLGNSEPSGLPFVVVSGTVQSATDMSKWAAGGGVVSVVALISTPPFDSTTFVLADVGQFDADRIAGADLTGTSVPFELILPLNSTGYLWAFLDADGDGTVNEVTEGDLKGTYLAPVGAISVGETAVADLIIPLFETPPPE